MELSRKTRRKPGPVADLNAVRTTVVLDKDLVEWGKNQPGGLSRLLRELLQEAAQRKRGTRQREEGSDLTTRAALAGPIGEIWDTPEEDEAWKHLTDAIQ
jgi:hypothetical protein